MNIRKSTLISVNIAAFVFLIVLLVTTNIVIDNSFERVEKNEVLADLSRLFEAMDSELQDLVVSTSDWAIWDDTWNFVQNPNPAYIESNFTSNTFSNYGLKLVVIYDLERNIVFARYYDEDTEELVYPDQELTSFIQSSLSRHLANGSVVKSKGYIPSPLGGLVFAAVPIVRSDGSGPHAGYMLMAKPVNGTVIAATEGFSGQKITAMELDMLSNPDLILRNKIAMVRADDPVHIKGRTSVSAYGISQGCGGERYVSDRAQFPSEAHQHCPEHEEYHDSHLHRADNLPELGDLYLRLQKADPSAGLVARPSSGHHPISGR